MAETPRQRLDARLAAMRVERSSWLAHWRDLSDYILPRRGRFLAGDRNRGVKRNSRIVNPTATLAVRTTVSGMNAGLTNPSSRWFRMTTENPDLAEQEGVRQWLDHVEERIYRVFARSNFYQQVNSLYEELLVFGTAALWQDEDRDDGAWFQAFTSGEFMLASDSRGKIDTCFREWEMTADQLVEEFGEDKVSLAVKQAVDRKKAGNAGGGEQWFAIAHAVMPRAKAGEGLAGRLAWASVYWEPFSPDKDTQLLRVKGYEECPVHGVRWDVTSPDIYGRSPGMDVLGDVKALMAYERRKGKAGDEASGFGATQGPPTIGGVDMSPGAHNVVSADATIKPLFVVPPNAVQIIGEEIRQLETRIRQALFADLFLMFQQLDQRMTATEVAQRAQEKMLVLGPLLTRLNTELYNPLIDRTYAQLERASAPLWKQGQDGPLPMPPPPLHGQQLKVEYVSSLQQAMKQAKLAPVQGLLQAAAAIRQLYPQDDSRLDKVDWDQILDETSEGWGASAGLLKSDDAVAALRDARAKAQQAAQDMAAVQQAAQVAPSVTGAMKDLHGMQAPPPGAQPPGQPPPGA